MKLVYIIGSAPVGCGHTGGARTKNMQVFTVSARLFILINARMWFHQVSIQVQFRKRRWLAVFVFLILYDVL